MDWRQVFLAALRELPDISAAARTAGVNRQHAYAVRKSDPAFAAAWDDALAEAVDVVEGVAFQMAKAKDPRMVMFWLQAHRPEIYGKKSEVKHSGDVGPTVADFVKGFMELGMSRQQAIALIREAKSLPEDDGQGDDGESRTLAVAS